MAHLGLTPQAKNQIVHSLLLILKRKPIRFWHAYSIWGELQKKHKRQAQILAGLHGPGAGAGGGKKGWGAARWIARTLEKHPSVHVESLASQDMAVGGAKTTARSMAIYCWNGSSPTPNGDWTDHAVRRRSGRTHP